MTNLPPDYINQNLAVIQRKHHSETALCSRHRPHGLNAELQGGVHIEKVNAALTKEKGKGKNMLSVRTPPSSTNIFIVRNSYQLSVNFSLRFQWTHLVFTLQQDKTFTQPSLLCCIRQRTQWLLLLLLFTLSSRSRFKHHSVCHKQQHNTSFHAANFRPLFMLYIHWVLDICWKEASSAFSWTFTDSSHCCVSARINTKRLN